MHKRKFTVFTQLHEEKIFRQWIRAECLALHRDRWLDSDPHRGYGIINMYRVLEIVTQQEPPAVPIS